MMALDLACQWLLVLCLLALFLGSAHLLGDWLHPAPLVALVWTIVCGSYLLMPHSLRMLSTNTMLLVSLAVASFALGSMIAKALEPQQSPATPQWRTTWLRSVLFWAALLGLPLFLLKAQALADSADYTESTYINLRIALTGELDDAQTFGLLAYLIPISFASALVELAASRRKLFETRGWIALLLALAYAVMATGRTYVFLLVIALAFVALLQARARPGQVACAGLAAFAAAFFGLGSLANKIGVDIVNTEALAALDALSLYLLGSLAAFDITLAHAPLLDWGANIFRSPLAVLAALGADVQVPPLVKPYVYIPEPTNVYTVFLPYFLDFGWVGVAVTFLLFGWLHSNLYRTAKRAQNPRLIILASLGMYPLLMQFFQDQYFSLLTTWITFAALVFPCFRRQPTDSSIAQPATSVSY